MQFHKVMFGENAIHIPINLIVQDAGDGRVCGVFQCVSHDLRFGSTATHQLIRCDAVFRPHVVLETDLLRGSGLNELARRGFVSAHWRTARTVFDGGL